MAHWLCETRCKDGTDISYTRPYCEDGVYMAEENRIYNLECELIDRAEKHGGVERHHQEGNRDSVLRRSRDEARNL